MLELAADLAAELLAGRAVAVVTVVGVPARAPRGVGAAMALTDDGRVIGSVSSGCVDGDCVTLAGAVLATRSTRRARFGFTDAAAHTAGLACGGSVDVVCCRLDPADPVVLAALRTAARGLPARLVMAVDGDDGARGIRCETLSTRADDPPAAIVPADGGDLLVVTRAARPALVLVGANEHAAALCCVATAAGWAVTVCDPWPALVTPERFPDAVALVADLPHAWLDDLVDVGALDPAATAVCVLTHDERIDLPALRAALQRPFAFVGAMGSRVTAARRRALLSAAGVSPAALDRLHTPLGLDLGGSDPGETAIAVMAEIVRVRHSASGGALRDLSGPIHRPAAAAAEPAISPPEPAYC